MIIWKFQLAVIDSQILSLPRGATILTVQMQCDDLQLWALCDADSTVEDRIIRIIGTGHSIPPNESERLRYINTFQMGGGSLVFHVFERK